MNLRRPYSAVIAAFATGLVAVVAFVGHSLWQTHERLNREAAMEADGLARLQQQYLFASIHETDLVLAAAGDEFRLQAADMRRPTQTFNV